MASAADRFSKLEKLSIFLIALGQERTREILADVDVDTLQHLNGAMAGLGDISATEKAAVMLEFAPFFDGIHGSVPGGALDHKPELLAHVLSEHAISPARSVMVGDRRHDIAGAHAVGMRGLGVLWGYGSREELETAGADRLVDSSTDLARTVLSMVNEN